MENKLSAKRVADSEVEQVQAIMPNHLNGSGRVFGGQLAAWIDIVGGIVARRHANRNVTTAAIQGGVVMNIRPSAAIRQNYNEIADMCRKTAEPVFLTKNGEGDLVVMDIETYNRREKMLKLREELLAVEEDRMRGSKGYSVDEVTAMMRSAIKEAAGHGAAE